ncbi:hypothetical protein Pelo_13980 [Pelomyxa schiedti]|nr:hypothetical protein Pelo_13980 [Pelomyxa schiedti]
MQKAGPQVRVAGVVRWRHGENKGTVGRRPPRSAVGQRGGDKGGSVVSFLTEKEERRIRKGNVVAKRRRGRRDEEEDKLAPVDEEELIKSARKRARAAGFTGIWDMEKGVDGKGDGDFADDKSDDLDDEDILKDDEDTAEILEPRKVKKSRSESYKSGIEEDDSDGDGFQIPKDDGADNLKSDSIVKKEENSLVQEETPIVKEENPSDNPTTLPLSLQPLDHAILEPVVVPIYQRQKGSNEFTEKKGKSFSEAISRVLHRDTASLSDPMLSGTHLEEKSLSAKEHNRDVSDNTQLKKLIADKDHVYPSSNTDEEDRALLGLARQGYINFYNAVKAKKQQLKMRRKAEKKGLIVAEASKSGIISVLQGGKPQLPTIQNPKAATKAPTTTNGNTHTEKATPTPTPTPTLTRPTKSPRVAAPTLTSSVFSYAPAPRKAKS